MKDAILKRLNSKQKEAVTFGEGPLLVLAGAGSGKTRVLTHRIAYLIAQGVPAYNFLAVTFTNKAAGEMKARIKRLVDAEVWVHTFHASCLRILKAERRLAGLHSHFSVYDENDQLAVIKECLVELKRDEKQYNPKTIKEKIDRAKDTLLSAKEYAERVNTYYDETVSKVYTLYEEKLKKYNGIDFGGLIFSCITLLRNHSRVLSKYQHRFHCILIDEYQDTNHAQYQWIKLLAAHHKNITVVGDPDQSIYGWRGADITNILTFEKDYPNAQVIRLEKNYRSTKNILNASNALIENNRARKEKILWTDAAEGELLSLYEARDERAEAEYVAQRILEIKRNGYNLNDIVVFYRIHAQSRILEDYLRRFNIPYRIIGGLRFYDRREIKDLTAYLRVITCPEDDVSLRRIINIPTRGIGAKAVAALVKYKEEQGVSLYKALSQVKNIPALGSRAQRRVKEFYDVIKDIRSRRNEVLPSEVLGEILKKTGYLAEFEKVQSFEAQSRLENIKEFIDVITEFEGHTSPSQDVTLLESFLDMISLQTNIDEWDQGEGILSLMTFHCAKGLEFSIVFMVGMEEEIFPHINVLNNAERELEEERRLCYVGITRGKEKVFFSYAQRRRLYGMHMNNLPSRFLGEIPAQYLLYSDDTFVAEEEPSVYDDDEVIEYQ